MKNKGFTVVEFAVSFCLIAAISLLLFQLVLSLKNLYLNGNVKSSLLARQGIMLQRINDDYDNNFLKNVSSCGLSCLLFTYTTPENTTKITMLEVDPYNNTITYDDYTMPLDTGNEFGDINVTYSTITDITSTSVNNSLLTIDIPIHNTLLDENFDIKINFPYKSSATTINIEMNASDIDIILDDMTIPVTTFSGTEGYFAEILSHDVSTEQNLFANMSQLLRSETTAKRSALFALDLFKDLYTATTTDGEVTINGYELILMYPSYSATEKNHWYQSSNFLKNELETYIPISIAWNNKWDTYGHFTGFNKVNEENECGFISSNDASHDNCYTTIGAKKLVNDGFMFNQNGTDLSATSMKLYVRCDNVIEKYALSHVVE